MIVIAPGAQVKADISANTIIISGKVIGNCEAKELLEMTEGAHLNGNILAKSIKWPIGFNFRENVLCSRNHPGHGIAIAIDFLKLTNHALRLGLQAQLASLLPNEGLRGVSLATGPKGRGFHFNLKQWTASN